MAPLRRQRLCLGPLAVAIVVGVLVGIATAILLIPTGCHPVAPTPAPPPACTGDVGLIHLDFCGPLYTPDLARCVICEGASACYVGDRYCVSQDYSCGDPWCVTQPFGMRRTDGGTVR